MTNLNGDGYVTETNTTYTAPVAETVVPERSFLSRFWWLLPLLALLIALPFILRGCNRTETPVTPAAPVTPVPPVATVEPTAPAPDDVIHGCTEADPCTLRVRWWGGDARGQDTMAVLELFQERNPGINIEANWTSFGEYYDQLTVETVAGTQPDVFTLDRAWPIELGNGGALLDLTQLHGLDLSPFPASALSNSTVDGRVYGVTTGGNATALLINKDIIDAAGLELPDTDHWTWEEFADFAQQVSENTPDGTFGVEVRPHAFLLAYINQRDGIGAFTADGHVNASPETIADFYNMIIDWQNRGAAPNAATTSELIQAGPEEQLFGQGLAAMTFTPSNGIIASAAAAGTDNMVLVRIPGETEFNNPGITVLASMFWAISSQTRYPEAAAALVNFLVNDPDAAEIIRVDRGVPVNETIASGLIPYLNPLQIEQVDYMNNIAQHAVPGPSLPAGSAEFEAITFRTLEGAMFGTTPVNQAAQDWVTQMQTALNDARQ